MGIWKRLTGWGIKESAVGGAIAQFYTGQAVSTPRQYDKLVDEAYIKNVIAYRCVAMIAGAVASVPWKLYDAAGKEITKHPALDLIAKPNPIRGGAYFIEELVSYLLLSGNAYIEKTIFSGKEPRELYNLRPDRVEVIPGRTGLPMGYKHTVNGVPHTFPADPITGESNICHLRKMHPLNDWYGLSPVEAAAYAVDQHNAAGLHNTALLQNSANPSGALVLKTQTGTPDQAKVDALSIALEAKYSSPRRAGKPMVLTGDFDWKPFSLSPKDLDFNEGKLAAARDICTAFGVPHELIVPGQSTYNNKAEAKLMLWEDTAIPVLDMLCSSFFPWVINGFAARGGGSGLVFKYDLNNVSALIPRREQHSLKVMREWQANIISRDEARKQLGYDELKAKGGEEFYSSSPFQEPGASESGASAKNHSPAERKALEDLRFITDEIDQPEIVAAVTSLFADKFTEVVRNYGAGVAEEIGRISALQITGAVQHHIQDTTAELIRQINKTTKAHIKVAIAEAIDNREKISQIQERIVEIFSGSISDYRAQRIAVTESTAATGFAADEAMAQSGITRKEWLAVIDGATRDTHAAMDGQVVGVDEEFVSPSGARAAFPGGFGDAAEDINCRCAIAAVFDGVEKARTFEERRIMWEERNRKRGSAETEMMTAAKKIFMMQGEMVLARLRQVHGEAEYLEQ